MLTSGEPWSWWQLYGYSFLVAGTCAAVATGRETNEWPGLYKLVFAFLFHGFTAAGAGTIIYENVSWAKGKPGTVIGISTLYGLGRLAFNDLKGVLLGALNRPTGDDR